MSGGGNSVAAAAAAAAAAVDEGPIPFIQEDGTGQFHVTEEATHFLRSLEGPVGVVCVAGLYRTGKSFVLNQVCRCCTPAFSLSLSGVGLSEWGVVVHDDG